MALYLGSFWPEPGEFANGSDLRRLLIWPSVSLDERVRLGSLAFAACRHYGARRHGFHGGLAGSRAPSTTLALTFATSLSPLFLSP